MHLSYYTFGYPFRNGFLFFNSYSCSLIYLEKEKAIKIMNNEFDCLSNDELTYLTKTNIVNDLENEPDIYIERFKAHLQKANKIQRPHFTILPTTACNARCPYCFEKGIKFKTMTKETADKVVDFILSKNVDDIRFTWFGGEPTLGINTIYYICEQMKQHNIKYDCSFISNGYLFDTIPQDKLKFLNIKRVQITIDDLYEKYNLIKNYINAKSPFEKVINNIHYLLDNHVSVNVRVNFDPSDISDFEKILDYLHDEFGNQTGFFIDFAQITGDDYKDVIKFDNNPYIKIFKKLFEYGYINKIKQLYIEPFHRCMIYSDNSFVIGPEGNVYKCEHVHNPNTNAPFMNLYTNDFNKEALEKWIKVDYPYNECKTCKFLPMCNGGCKAYRFEYKNTSSCYRLKNCFGDVLKMYAKYKYNL